MDQINTIGLNTSGWSDNAKFNCTGQAEFNIEVRALTGILRHVSPVDDAKNDPVALKDVEYSFLEGVHDYAGLNFLSDWIARGSRKIELTVSDDGYILIRLTSEQSPDKEHEFDIVALVLTALVHQMILGANSGRSFPVGTYGGNDMRIPSECVWPLRFQPDSNRFLKLELPAIDNKTLGESDYKPAKVDARNPGFRTLPNPENYTMDEALAERFRFTTQAHIRVLRKTMETEALGRDFRSSDDSSETLQAFFSKDAKFRNGLRRSYVMVSIASFVKWSSLLLCLIWALVVISTLLGSTVFTKDELWWITLLFVGIAIWRFLASLFLVTATRPRALGARRSFGIYSRLTTWITNTAFFNKYCLFSGPLALICVVFLFVVTAELPVDSSVANQESTVDEGFSQAMPGFVQNLLENIVEGPDDRAHYLGTFSELVWALPLLAAALLRQSYIQVSGLVLERSGTQSRIEALEALTRNWEKRPPDERTMEKKDEPDTIGNILTSMLEQNREELKKVNVQFGEKSAFNAGFVALLSFLGPLRVIEPQTEEPSQISRFVDGMGLFNQSSVDTTISSDAGKIATLIGGGCNWDSYLSQAGEIDQASLEADVVMLALMTCLNQRTVGQLHATNSSMFKESQRAFQQREAMITTQSAVVEGTRINNFCFSPFSESCVNQPTIDLDAGEVGQVTANLDEVEARLSALLATLRSLQDPHLVNVTVDTQSVEWDLSDIADILDDIERHRIVSVTLDSEAAGADVNALGEQLSNLTQARNVPVRVTLEPTLSAVAKLEETLASFADGVMIPVEVDTNDALWDIELLISALRDLPNSHAITIEADITQAIEALRYVLETIGTLPTQHDIVLTAEVEQALWNLRALETALSGLPDARTVQAKFNHRGALEAITQLQLAIGQLPEEHSMIVSTKLNGTLEVLANLRTILTSLFERGELPLSESGDLLPISIESAFLNIEFPYLLNPNDSSTQVPLSLVLNQCHWIGHITFPVNEPEAGETAELPTGTEWFEWPDGGNLTRSTSENVTEEARDYIEKGQTIVVLGIADGQGDATYNLGLAERRARIMSAYVAGETGIDSSPFVIPLGESGWLTRLGLPSGNDSQHHRSAVILSCSSDTLSQLVPLSSE